MLHCCFLVKFEVSTPFLLDKRLKSDLRKFILVPRELSWVGRRDFSESSFFDLRTNLYRFVAFPGAHVSPNSKNSFIVLDLMAKFQNETKSRVVRAGVLFVSLRFRSKLVLPKKEWAGRIGIENRFRMAWGLAVN